MSCRRNKGTLDSGAWGGNEGIGLSAGPKGLNTKYIWPRMRMVCGSEGLLQKLPTQIAARQRYSSAGHLIADKRHDKDTPSWSGRAGNGAEQEQEIVTRLRSASVPASAFDRKCVPEDQTMARHRRAVR